MLNFRNTVFIKSATDYHGAPTPALSEVLLVGRSNVGKSSLINALTDNSHLAFTSSKPGHTRLLNYFSVNREFYLVDAPGYGYSAAGKAAFTLFAQMMENYFSGNQHLAGVLFLLDSRRAPGEDDINFFEFIQEQHVPFLIVLTKCDKLNQSGKVQIRRWLSAAFKTDNLPICEVSILKKDSLIPLARTVERWL